MVRFSWHGRFLAVFALTVFAFQQHVTAKKDLPAAPAAAPATDSPATSYRSSSNKEHAEPIIEEVTAKQLERVLNEKDYVAVFWCRYHVFFENNLFVYKGEYKAEMGWYGDISKEGITMKQSKDGDMGELGVEDGRRGRGRPKKKYGWSVIGEDTRERGVGREMAMDIWGRVERKLKVADPTCVRDKKRRWR